VSPLGSMKARCAVCMTSQARLRSLNMRRVLRVVFWLLALGAWAGLVWVIGLRGPIHADVRGAVTAAVDGLALTIPVLITVVASRFSDRLHYQDPQNQYPSAGWARYQVRERRRQAKADRRLYG
jgi:hypothetical protein